MAKFETLGGVLSWVRELFTKPLYQSLILMLGTVFVLGSQFAVWQAGTETSMTSAFVVLTVLYFLKSCPTLLREIKETPNDQPSDYHSQGAGGSGPPPL